MELLLLWFVVTNSLMSGSFKGPTLTNPLKDSTNQEGMSLNKRIRVTSLNCFQGMGFVTTVLLSVCCISFEPKIASAATFDVTSYGAKGDGNTDDSQAFLQAWGDLCGDESADPTLIIPSDMTFLLSPMAFNGSSCKSPNINIKLLGNIIAPNTLDGWRDCIDKRFWIYFTMVKGLTIDGPGKIDGQGSLWWRKEAEFMDGEWGVECGRVHLRNSLVDNEIKRGEIGLLGFVLTVTTETCDRPSALHFYECKGLRLSGTTHINSPFIHISITGCQDVDVGYLQIISPGDSPNTDGIDISSSSHVNIHDSTIQTGDDCVAINGGIIDINVTGVFCGPGHGISIGSLGENGQHDTVEQVRVQNCNIIGTTNGLRIKTVPNGTGYARDIIFQDIYLVDAKNPIIIDQYYGMNSTHVDPAIGSSATAVQVSDVTYMNIHGSSASKHAIIFNCSDTFGCNNIITNNVKITGNDVLAICKNVQGEFVDTIPSISCA